MAGLIAQPKPSIRNDSRTALAFGVALSLAIHLLMLITRTYNTRNSELQFKYSAKNFPVLNVSTFTNVQKQTISKIKQDAVSRRTKPKKKVKKESKHIELKPVADTSTPPSSSQQQSLSKNFTESVLYHQKPNYPRIALLRKWQGKVEIKLKIGPDGQVINVLLVEGSGFDLLDKSAIEAARSWKFQKLADTYYFVKKVIKFQLKKN